MSNTSKNNIENYQSQLTIQYDWVFVNMFEMINIDSPLVYSAIDSFFLCEISGLFTTHLHTEKETCIIVVLLLDNIDMVTTFSMYTFFDINTLLQSLKFDQIYLLSRKKTRLFSMCKHNWIVDWKKKFAYELIFVAIKSKYCYLIACKCFGILQCRKMLAISKHYL